MSLRQYHNKNLRDLVVEALYPVSANQLPAVCEHFGLSPGSREEAFSSKRAYVRSRLLSLSDEDVIRIAREALMQYPNYDIEECILKIEEAPKRKISEATRRDIEGALSRFDISGRVDIKDFCRNVWPIEKMTSPFDSSRTVADDLDDFKTAAYNHEMPIRFNIFEAMDLYTCSQWKFITFLEAVVHPRTRTEVEQINIVEQLNPILEWDGFAFRRTGKISRYPKFTICEIEFTDDRPADTSISAALASFDEASVHAAWKKAVERRTTDPQGAITAARTLLETVCKHIIEDAGGSYRNSDDLPKLYLTAATHLNLAPDQHTEGVFKSILGNCQSIVNNLGSLRNRLSDAHGHGRRPARPLPRHAELAVNLAGAVATFLVATYKHKSQQRE